MALEPWVQACHHDRERGPERACRNTFEGEGADADGDGQPSFRCSLDLWSPHPAPPGSPRHSLGGRDRPYGRPPGCLGDPVGLVQKSGSPTDTSQSLTEQRRLLLATVKRTRTGRRKVLDRAATAALGEGQAPSEVRAPASLAQESAKSTTTGAWSDGFCPFRASRSRNDPVALCTRSSLTRTRSMRRPRPWWKSPAR
jgi:hypothetical protein